MTVTDPTIPKDLMRSWLNDATATLANAKIARDEAIRQATAQGWSTRQIARETGLSHARISQINRGTR